ncbi:hypothetical protein LSH36_31g09031 [Paralvinella palmiformis]|uniref:RGS domain-containing protein n=1 Tax=Paralvinella palmiformis TaxID=53620 RepID=A0AAD9K9Y9_9ANNE|nr:hypothetical protein LSH36_31g09031 [Paralvinella palmiformis]
MQNKQRLELADYEAENLARLQKMFSRKWEFIFMQAEAQAKVDKKRDKLERKVLDSQERAFWDVHRPAPGCVNTTEIDIKKACKVNKPLRSYKHNYTVPGGRISPSVSETDLKNPVDNLKVEYVLLIRKDIPQWRVKRWAFSIYELLHDPAGREHFRRFLEKEISAENLNEFLAPGAKDPVNVDCRVAETVKKNIENCPDRYCFAEAEEHIFNLMKSDSYSRYLRSDMYKEFLSGTKKKVSVFSFHFPARIKSEASLEK